MTKKVYYLFITIVLLLGLLTAVSCKQDPIFFIISTEPAPKKPLIEGAPTNMTVFEREYQVDDPDNPGTQKTVSVSLLYVASGRLHWYAKAEKGYGNSGWDSDEYAIPQPAGKIIFLAAAQDRLYALCMDGHGVSATLRYITNDGDEWKNLAVDSSEEVYTLIQSIYADPETGQLFACTRNNSGNTYAILYLEKTTDTLKTLQSNTDIFSGMAYKNNTYYLCTRGAGIFKVDETSFTITQLTDASDTDEDNLKNDRTFMGIIKLNDTAIIAVERDGGALYEVDADSFKKIKYSGGEKSGEWIATDKYATGALAIWEDYLNPQQKLLIAGIQGGLYNTSSSSYTHGYVEFELTIDDTLNTASFRHDSGRLQSVHDNNDRYTATIGKHPINHLFQAPREVDDNMIFFASTQTAGLWSYRYREDNDGWQWNAEE